MAKAIGWLLGVLAIASVGMHFDNGEVLAGIICFFAIGFLIPPILNKINSANKKSADEKGKTHSATSQKSANILGVVILIVAAFIGSGSDPKPENETVEKAQEKKQTIDSSERGQLKPIDLIYQLITKVDELDYWFKGPFKANDKLRFYDVKNSYDKQLDIICEDFDRLVKDTGNLNSEYYDESLACKNFRLSLVHVIQNLKSGSYDEIPKLREKFEPDYQNLKQQVDEEIKRLNSK
ncbi:hypothetical protein [Pseudoalteromonas sp. H105]|uniref:hypothetical protein n=1 Tax=Pseudoalteromonas sp. H105 TaxID=1348393 RepID=UPI00073208F0|nr:hypothetical protein [Pseudoalteromonas sp. H105]KTF14809.1 hypothetical protein ATS75_11915 [Pseudoalteromonas sp. H105]